VIGNRKDGILFEPALTVHRLQFMVEDRLWLKTGIRAKPESRYAGHRSLFFRHDACK